MSSYTVYALTPPDSDVVKYIGMTTLPLKRRLQWHLFGPTNMNMVSWIAELERANTVPRIRLVRDGLTFIEARDLEVRLIERYRDGDDLLNVRHNGGYHKHRRVFKVALPLDLSYRLLREAGELQVELPTYIVMCLERFSVLKLEDYEEKPLYLEAS